MKGDLAMRETAVKRVYSENADFQKFEVLKTNRNKRYKYGEFFVEGVRNLNEAVKNGWEISSFLYSSAHGLSGWAKDMLALPGRTVDYDLAPALLTKLSGKEDTSELMAVVKMRPDDPARLQFGPCPLAALFDRPSNRGNLGTILRSCDALGVEALVLTGHGVDLYDPDTVTSSMGSFFRVPTLRLSDNSAVEHWMEGMRQAYPGFQVVGTSAHGDTLLQNLDLTLPTLFLIGNETDGLARWYKEHCDVLAAIPMSPDSSASSFNVGCAATVLFYEAVRQRGE